MVPGAVDVHVHQVLDTILHSISMWTESALKHVGLASPNATWRTILLVSLSFQRPGSAELLAWIRKTASAILMRSSDSSI